jgi:hypothetical protein
MRNLFAAATLLIAGCSAAQDELRRDGKRFQVSSVRTPLGAASCVARNIEAAGGLTTSIGQVGESNAFEVSARNTNSNVVRISARAEPILKGSIIVVWIGPTLPNPEGAFANAVKGC